MWHAIGEMFTLKKESVKEPDLYLDTDIERVHLEHSEHPGKTRRAMSSTKYTKKLLLKLNTS